MGNRKIRTKMYTSVFYLMLTVIIMLMILSVCANSLILYFMRKKFDYDDLTALYTLEKFKKEATKILLQSQPDEYSVICIDINEFRYITESLGQDISDSVLRTLSDHFKKSAPPGTLLCRRHEDNFIILMKSVLRPVIEDYILSMTSIASKMESLLPLYYTIEFSVGVYIVKNCTEKIDSMIYKAETARVIGKKSLNPRRISFYDEKMDTDSEQEKEILFDMNRAFENGEFIPYYQPKFRFSDAKITGAEALVRWNHPKKGIIPPGYFVPLFEKNGFISKIDKRIFEQVCQFLDSWNTFCAAHNCEHPLTISCNLSRFQLYNPDFVKEYTAIASKYQIAPSKIELELTESLMMDNKERLLKAMKKIRNAAFDISVDDFGSGFSSLSLLKDIPASVIKLDKEFLTNTASLQKPDGTDVSKDNIIITSVIDMAKKLNMLTVAEGIEEESQAETLKNMGCDIAQGYFFAKPMSETDFKNLLHEKIEMTEK